MTTMLDKCAVAGDITQGIDRRGVWTAAITVIGGTRGTAVKLVSSDTVNGEYTDYKTLISAADAETDQYKGFVVDLHGAKKFIKVTGAVMATAVFGDCDHDVKAIAITEGEVPSGADLENNKAATIDASTYTSPVEVTPSEGKDGMKKATITLSNIPSGGVTTLYAWEDESNHIYYTNFDVAPAEVNANHKIVYAGSSEPYSAIDYLSFLNYISLFEDGSYRKDTDTSFTILDYEGDPTQVFTRDSENDIVL